MRGPITLALAGDTMLGRGVAEQLGAHADTARLFSDELREITAGADLFVLNLECCISSRGVRHPDPGKLFHFRAPPVAAAVLAELGADCVTLANNHALDYGPEALADTLAELRLAGVRAVGAGPDEAAARTFAVLETAGGARLAVIGVSDHPEDYAAGPDRPGIAWAELRDGVPPWLAELVGRATEAADGVLVTPHWGPNMTAESPAYIRRAGAALLDAGADLVAGHSAHVFHGVADRILYDLGDFIDDYAVDPVLRNDLGLLFLVTLDGCARLRPVRVQAVPLFLDYCRTEPARGAARRWIRERFVRACQELGTPVAEPGGSLVIDWS